MKESFPLYWPVGYKRTIKRTYSRFKVTMDKAQQFLRAELGRMGATNLIVSTNIPTRKDGGLYADWMKKKIDNPGVAIYFDYKGKEISMCCDQYEKVWENVYALGKGIEALRGMARWGVSDFLERAFTGFTAIPETTGTPIAKQWFEILGIKENASKEEIKQTYRTLVKIHHPDMGGSPETFDLIKMASQHGLNRN